MRRLRVCSLWLVMAVGWCPTVWGQYAVTGFTLIDADTDVAVAGFDPIPSGGTINLADLASTNVNVRVNTTPGTDFGSVQMNLTGATVKGQLENVPPWALWGDSSGNFNAGSLSTGAHSMSATPYDANGGAGGTGTAGTPLTIPFTVVDVSTGPPTVSITSPLNGTTVNEPANFLVQADASDPGGSVAQVEFFEGGTNSLGVDTTAPYEVAWNGVTAGSYTLTAEATDNELNETISAPVTVNVIVPGVGGTVSGELKRWHCVSVTFDGPTVNESDNPSPFLQYRLDVTFTGPSGQVSVVPGFFAADGNAGITGATSGNKWRVRFAPDEVGEWSYMASFTTGTNASVDGGGTVTSFNGASGTFTVAESDKSGRDFRSPEKGLIKNRGHFYLTYANGKPWVKGGPDIPENVLGYLGFDNTPAPPGTDNRHDFAAHVTDWNVGDADWDSPNNPGTTDGRGIIGALNYIAELGGNCIYFLPMNVGGDAKDTFPTLASGDKTHYDVSKLAQWDFALAHAQEQGIFLHFQLAETESGNENYHDGGTLGPERKLYYRELLARFGYLLGSEWDIGEENDYGTTKRIQFAAHLKSIDPYDHPVTTHIHTNQFDNFYNGLLGNGDIDKATWQCTLGASGLNLTAAENRVEEWRRRSSQAGVPWMISIDEPQTIQNNDSEANGYPQGRKEFLWPLYLSGAGGFEWYVQQDGGGHSLDQQVNDFGILSDAITWTGYALGFLERLPLLDMAPDKTLGSSSAGGTMYCLADPGRVYALYHEDGGTFTLDLTGESGEFSVRWFDPRNGGALQIGAVTSVTGGTTVALGNPPDTTTEDWVALVESAKKILFIRGAERSGGGLEGGTDAGKTEHLADINNFTIGGGNHGWGTLSNVLREEGFVLEQMIEPLETGAPGTGQTMGAHIDLELVNLSQYALVVFGSNNAVDYDSAAINAVESYVRGGGAALFISDGNFGSSRCDAPTSDQLFLDKFGLVMNQDRATYNVDRASGEFTVPGHPIFEGVDVFRGEGVSPGFIPAGAPPAGVVITKLAGVEAGKGTKDNDAAYDFSNCNGSNRAETAADCSLLVATVDSGRVGIHFDRNTFFNLGGQGADIEGQDNKQYARNLFGWLANDPPVVSAGSDFSVVLPAGGSVMGTVSDDDCPEPGGLTVLWSKVSGPGAVSFNDATSAGTGVSFGMPGVYVLRLTGDDGEKEVSDEVTVTVNDSFAAWAVREACGNTDADADDDGDGVTAFGEYAAGVNPKVADHELATPLVAMNGGSLAIVYRRAKYATDVTFTPERAETLGTGAVWDGTPSLFTEMVIADDGMVETVRATLVEPIQVGLNVFLRVKHDV